MGLEIFFLTPAHQPILWEFLALAAHEADVDRVKTNPDLTRYARDWGRNGDCGVFVERDKKVIGACCVRLFFEADRAFGWVDAQTPELTMAVLPEARGEGVGKIMLGALQNHCAQKLSCISLNVREDNLPALRLYKRFGFKRIEGSESVNRVGSQSFNMIWRHEK